MRETRFQRMGVARGPRAARPEIVGEGAGSSLEFHDGFPDLGDRDYSNVRANKLDLRSGVFRRSAFQSSHLTGCCLKGADLRGTNWFGSTMRMCTLDEARAAEACFERARVEDCSAAGIDLSSASLRGARLTETLFERANLRHAVLDCAEGVGIGFRGADLNAASLRGVRFEEPDFRGADLRNADLAGGSFRNGDFRGALIEGASFDGADFGGALLDAGSPLDGTRAQEAGRADESPTAAALQTMLADALRVLFDEQGGADSLGAAVSAALDRRGGPAAAETLSPEELRQWGRSLSRLAKGDTPGDLAALVDVLSQGPVDFRRLVGSDAATWDEAMARAQDLLASLAAAGDEPAPWLKPLILALQDELGAAEGADVQALLRRLLNRG